MEDLYDEVTIARTTLRGMKISRAGRVWKSKGLIGQITKWEPRTLGDLEDSLDKDRRTEYKKNTIIGCKDNTLESTKDKGKR